MQSETIALTGKGEAYAASHSSGMAVMALLSAMSHAGPEAKRQAAADAIEDLINFLDALDTDADLEPSLAGFAGGSTDDREGGDVQDEPHDARDEGDDEPWLAGPPSCFVENDVEGASWTEHSSRYGCLHGGHDDGEEGTLGWTLSHRQEGSSWLRNDDGGCDREAEHDGREPDADFEAVNEDGGNILDEPHDAAGTSVLGGGSGKL